MYLSVYSFAVAVLWAAIFISLISFFRKKSQALQRFSLYPLFLALFFCALRVVLPLELPYTRSIHIQQFLPVAQKLLGTPFFQFQSISINLKAILFAIWMIGIVIHSCKHIKDYCHFRRLLHMLPASQEKRLTAIYAAAVSQNRLRNIKIIVHKSVASPAIVGCIHPIIILPDIPFSDDELFGIFVHEDAHFKYKHHFIKLLLELACICFWWNPTLKKLSSETAHALEMHADQAVCTKLNREQQKNYLRGITKVIQNMDSVNPSPAVSCGLLERTNKEDIQQRFQMILGNHYKSSQKRPFMILPLALSLFLLSYLFVIQPYSEPRLADYGEVDTSPDTNYYCIKSGSGYELYEYPGRFIGYVDKLEGHMQWIQIYDKTYRNYVSYKYKKIEGKIWKRLWSHTHNRWEEPDWTPV